MESSSGIWAMNSTPSAGGGHEDTVPPPTSWTPYLILGFVGYVSLCSALRFRRVNNLQSRFKFTDRASLSRMTLDDAQTITKDMVHYEFPILYDISLRLALFKTYALKNVAKVLVAVSDLAKPKNAPKRYEDTAILYACFANFSPESDEFLKAVARMNYLHAPYIKSGKILNEDLLYVLYASMAEPVRFMRLYEWRALTEMEHAALGALWKHVGDLMGIDYAAELGNNQWKDGIEFMDEVEAWAGKFEDEYMRPLDEVRILGEVLMDLLLTSYPKFMRPAGYQMSLVLMGDRMRRAFGFPEPGLAPSLVTYGLLFARFLVVRYLSLPRLIPVTYFSGPDPNTGRMHHHSYLKEPWYNASTFWSRWGPEAWATWACGGQIPGDEAELKPEGFLFEDIGPRYRMGKGHDEISKAGQLATVRPSSVSPFAPPVKS